MDDLNALQQLTDSTTSNVAGKLLEWIMVPSLILTVVILVLYIAAVIRRHRVETAIFEIRDLLKDMKTAGQLPPASAATPPAPAPVPAQADQPKPSNSQ